jgi:hypothetical protein
MSARLTFDADAHVYTLDGEVVPSVTQVLEAVRLIDLYHLPRETRERALERGRRVHAAIHYLIEGSLEIMSVDDEDRGYLDAAEAFLKDAALIPVLFEHRVCHPPLRYAGTTDLVAWWNGELAVVDWKSSLNPTSLCADLQLAAYVEALRLAMPAEVLDYDPAEPIRRVGVSLRKDGSYKATVYGGPVEQIRDFGIFRAALTVCHEQRRRRGKGHA